MVSITGIDKYYPCSNFFVDFSDIVFDLKTEEFHESVSCFDVFRQKPREFDVVLFEDLNQSWNERGWVGKTLLFQCECRDICVSLRFDEFPVSFCWIFGDPYRYAYFLSWHLCFLFNND